MRVISETQFSNQSRLSFLFSFQNTAVSRLYVVLQKWFQYFFLQTEAAAGHCCFFPVVALAPLASNRSLCERDGAFTDLWYSAVEDTVCVHWAVYWIKVLSTRVMIYTQLCVIFFVRLHFVHFPRIQFVPVLFSLSVCHVWYLLIVCTLAVLVVIISRPNLLLICHFEGSRSSNYDVLVK